MVWPVRRCSLKDRTCALALCKASLLIAGRNDVKLRPFVPPKGHPSFISAQHRIKKISHGDSSLRSWRTNTPGQRPSDPPAGASTRSAAMDIGGGQGEETAEQPSPLPD
jgi:hypothetical protein